MKFSLSELTKVCQSILRTETYSKILSKYNITLAMVKSRIELLDQKWEKYEHLRLQIKASKTSAKPWRIDYFIKNKFFQIEDAYMNAHDI